MVVWLTRVPRVRKVWSLNPVAAKSGTVLKTIHHRLNMYNSI